MSKEGTTPVYEIAKATLALRNVVTESANRPDKTNIRVCIAEQDGNPMTTMAKCTVTFTSPTAQEAFDHAAELEGVVKEQGGKVYCTSTGETTVSCDVYE